MSAMGTWRGPRVANKLHPVRVRRRGRRGRRVLDEDEPAGTGFAGGGRFGQQMGGGRGEGDFLAAEVAGKGVMPAVVMGGDADEEFVGRVRRPSGGGSNPRHWGAGDGD